MCKLFTIICVTIPLAAVDMAQTSTDLANKYRHHEVYEVQPGIQMTARFATNGLVCEMQVEPTNFKKDEVDLGSGIDNNHIDNLLDQLVPSSERGEEDTSDPANGMVMGTGQVMENVRSYTNVRVDILSSHATTVLTIEWRDRTCQP